MSILLFIALMLLLATALDGSGEEGDGGVLEAGTPVDGPMRPWSV